MSPVGNFRVTRETPVRVIKARAAKQSGEHGYVLAWENDDGWRVFALLDQGEYRTTAHSPDGKKWYVNLRSASEAREKGREALALITDGKHLGEHGFNRLDK